jgi:hypothetical protein
MNQIPEMQPRMSNLIEKLKEAAPLLKRPGDSTGATLFTDFADQVEESRQEIGRQEAMRQASRGRASDLNRTLTETAGLMDNIATVAMSWSEVAKANKLSQLLTAISEEAFALENLLENWARQV